MTFDETSSQPDVGSTPTGSSTNVERATATVSCANSRRQGRSILIEEDAPTAAPRDVLEQLSIDIRICAKPDDTDGHAG